MSFVFDWFLIIFGTFFTIKAYKKICFEKNCSISNIIISLVYIFCILPIVMNYFCGIPNYDTVYWYKVFISSMNNEKVSIIYDIYIFISILLLYLYSRKYKLKDISSKKLPLLSSKYISFFIIILPYIYIIFTGTLSNYSTYGIKSYRGLENVNTSYFVTIFALTFLSLFAYYSNFFRKEKRNVFSYILFLIYNFSIIWISGKRFIIATIFFMIIYYLSQSDLKFSTRKKMYRFVPIIMAVLVALSPIYLNKLKPLNNTSSSNDYDMLRVDFGRDDVIKYVIDQELLQHNRILEYRGESFLSAIFVLIPRKIWHSKPYPHYMYLTSSILNRSIFNLPAGTTPSWYEMCIANFGVMGMFIACLGLVFICKIADNSNYVDIKYIWLLFAEVLLTQSIDSYVIYIVILLFIMLYMFLKKLKEEK